MIKSCRTLNILWLDFSLQVPNYIRLMNGLDVFFFTRTHIFREFTKTQNFPLWLEKFSFSLVVNLFLLYPVGGIKLNTVSRKPGYWITFRWKMSVGYITNRKPLSSTEIGNRVHRCVKIGGWDLVKTIFHYSLENLKRETWNTSYIVPENNHGFHMKIFTFYKI